MKKPMFNYAGAIFVGILACVLFSYPLAAADDDVQESAESLYQSGVKALEQKDYKTGLTLFRRMQTEHPRSRRAVRGWEYIAVCENELGDPYAAFEAYQKIWDDHKDFSRLSVITRNQMKIGDYYLNYKRYDLAISIYTKILENAPFSEVAPAAQFSLARAQIGKKQYETAKIELNKLIRNYPTSQLVDDAAFDIGYVDYLQSDISNYDQAITANAIASFRRFIHDFPSSPKVPQAQEYIRALRGRKAATLYRTAEFYENIRANKAAEIMYREVIDQFPDTTYADNARAHLEGLKGLERETAVRTRDERTVQVLGDNKAAAVARENKERAGVGLGADVRTPLGEARVGTGLETGPAGLQVESIAAVEPGRPAAAGTDSQRTQYFNTEKSRKIEDMIKDPVKRKELKEYMLQEYAAEKKRELQMKAELKQNNLELLGEARRAADRFPVETTEVAVSVPGAGIDVAAVRQPEAGLVQPVTRTETAAEPKKTIAASSWQPLDTGVSVSADTGLGTEVSVSADAGTMPDRPVAGIDISSSTTEETLAADNARDDRTIVDTAISDESYAVVDYQDKDQSLTETKKVEYEPGDSRTIWQDLQKDREAGKQAKAQDVVDSMLTDTSVGTSAGGDTYVIDLTDTESTQPATDASATIADTAVDAGVYTETEAAMDTARVSLIDTENVSVEDKGGIDEAAGVEVAVNTPLVSADVSAGTGIRNEVTVGDAQSTQLAAERLKEQQRAREARQKMEALRGSQETEDSWEKRTIPNQGKVRRAQYDKDTREKAATEYNIDALKQEYARVYYVIQEGDAAREAGMYNSAKQKYGKALDDLIAIKKKAPTWESEIINYRINYCRDFLRQVE